MIKLITFDIGGTIIKSDKSMSRYEQLKKVINISKDEYKKTYYLSKKPFNKLFADYIEKDKSEQYDRVQNILLPSKNKKFNEKIVNLIENLHNLGYKIATLSNVNYNLYYGLSDTILGKYIDKEFYSFEIGDYKPHKEAFLYVQNYYNLKPEEIMHIGDSRVSDYEGALNAGWNSYLYTNDINIDELIGIITKS